MLGKSISHYKILEKLGEGGMCMVYKAQDTKLKRSARPKRVDLFGGDNDAFFCATECW